MSSADEDGPDASGTLPERLPERLLKSARGDRPMQGWERVLFYLMVLYCGGEFVADTFLPAAAAFVG
jgi:hypothetical protein